jgi:hypothetical protein
MNSLSWMIYLADVVGSIGVLFAISATLLAGAIAFSMLWAAIEEEDIRMCRPYVKWLAPAMVSLALIAALLPSRTTVYAIAASETGENILNSDTGNKAVSALNAWLDRQIAGEPGEASE